MASLPTVLLKPVVRFREFPFGTASDPSIRDAVRDRPGEHQDGLLAYLRSGLVLGVTMGADLTDWLDPPHKANPVIDGQPRGGLTEMTDGVYLWHAGLIHFIQRYNLAVLPEFLDHAARQGWAVRREQVPPAPYEVDYFGRQPESSQSPVPAG